MTMCEGSRRDVLPRKPARRSSLSPGGNDRRKRASATVASEFGSQGFSSGLIAYIDQKFLSTESGFLDTEDNEDRSQNLEEPKSPLRKSRSMPSLERAAKEGRRKKSTATLDQNKSSKAGSDGRASLKKSKNPLLKSMSMPSLEIAAKEGRRKKSTATLDQNKSSQAGSDGRESLKKSSSCSKLQSSSHRQRSKDKSFAIKWSPPLDTIEEFRSTCFENEAKYNRCRRIRSSHPSIFSQGTRQETRVIRKSDLTPSVPSREMQRPAGRRQQLEQSVTYALSVFEEDKHNDSGDALKKSDSSSSLHNDSGDVLKKSDSSSSLNGVHTSTAPPRNTIAANQA